MGSTDIEVFVGCIDSSPDASDYSTIPKVVLQVIIVSEKEACTAYPSKRQNMRVVRLAYLTCLKRLSFEIHFLIVETQSTSTQQGSSQPSEKLSILTELIAQLASNCQLCPIRVV